MWKKKTVRTLAIVRPYDIKGIVLGKDVWLSLWEASVRESSKKKKIPGALEEGHAIRSG